MEITLLLFLILVIVLDLAMFRPRRRETKKHAIMLNSIEIGQIVYTQDGVRGEVRLLDRDQIVLACGPQKTQLLFALEAIERVEAYDKVVAEAKMKEKIQRNRRRF